MFPQIFGKYVLEREIAAGGMARVYLATLRGAVGFEKRLVVKQIRPELASDDAFVRRFVEEAKTTVELSHPNIVPVYELGVERGVYYIAMEHCDGLTLSDVLRETGPLTPEEGAQVGVEVCRALDYARRRVGIVHRDVTPRNVLIDEEGAVRLIDFGIAAPATASGVEKDEVFGSPGHMPPEQLTGSELTPAADVFAVGVLLIEAWTGRPPFRRATAEESIAALAHAQAPLTEQDPRLEPLTSIVARAIALDATERLEHAEFLGRPLRDFLKTIDTADVAQRLGARVQRARRRSESSLPWQVGDGVQTQSSATRPLPLASDESEASRSFALNTELEAWTRKLAETPDITPESAAPHSSARRSELPPGTSERPAQSAARFKQRLALVGAVLGAVLWFSLRPRHPATPVQAASRNVAKAPATAAARGQHAAVASAYAAFVAPVSAPRSMTTTSAIAPASAAPQLASSATPNAASAARAQGSLRLTADPLASVRIEGEGFFQQVSTPVRALSLPVGSYRLTFRSDTYGAPVATRVTIVRGATHSVHADFREAEPKLSIR